MRKEPRVKVTGLGFAGLLLLFWVLPASAFAGNEGAGFDIIYPKSESHLIFSHKTHKAISCRKCHNEIYESSITADRNLPDERACAECHPKKVRKETNEPGDVARCSYCHDDYDKDNKRRPQRIFWPKAKIRFPHDIHVMRLIGCQACHGDMTKIEKTGGRHLPTEAVCLSCHARKSPEKKKTDCTFCHEKAHNDKMRLSFDGKKLIPQTGEMNHGNDWTTRHATLAKLEPKRCETCHQKSDCNRCHDGVMRPMKIHPGNYVQLHPIDARKNRKRCAGCHRYQSFCIDCHQKYGLTKEAVRQSERKQVHPPGFASCTRGATHHAFQARRSISACTACHKEADCIRCHQSGSACGGRFNIHKHLTRDQLKRMQKRNPSACKKCHTNAR